ncbi:hypothetical protein [Streptomyces sp. NPDC058739]|uniref:hypothetical protein n=1 Tax=Streptomyces sp. NPDC058739 TaxID=3346618 RepID=UPI0036CE0EC3
MPTIPRERFGDGTASASADDSRDAALSAADGRRTPGLTGRPTTDGRRRPPVAGGASRAAGPVETAGDAFPEASAAWRAPEAMERAETPEAAARSRRVPDGPAGAVVMRQADRPAAVARGGDSSWTLR